MGLLSNESAGVAASADSSFESMKGWDLCYIFIGIICLNCFLIMYYHSLY